MQDPSLQSQSRLPAYLRIAHLLRQRIAQGFFKTDEFLPPERDLATELHVSRQTIRLAIDALRQEGIVLPEQGRGTRIVRDRSSEELPKTDQFHLAALIIYGMSRESSAAIFQGCEAVMRRADYNLIVAETALEATKRADNEAAHLRALLDKGIRGIIIYAEPTDQNGRLLKEALERGVQVVQIDRYLPGLPCDYVGVDNRVAAREMTDHLWQMGHRRIAFLSLHSEPSTCQERRQGYLDSLKAHGIADIDPELIAYHNSEMSTEAEVTRMVDDLLALPHPPDAIFAINDDLAFLVMQALRRQGLHLPDDMAVVGFDNQRVAGFVSPGLTSVQQPFVDLGKTAAQLLLHRMMGRYSGLPRRVLLPTQLIIRQSCGADPTPMPLTATRHG
jgi:DNA-binding LacI/PurR family transcriptional regulator